MPIPGVAIGAPHFGQAEAAVETCVPHSGHFTRAIFSPHCYIIPSNVRVLAEARLGADSQEPIVGLMYSSLIPQVHRT